MGVSYISHTLVIQNYGGKTIISSGTTRLHDQHRLSCYQFIFFGGDGDDILFNLNPVCVCVCVKHKNIMATLFRALVSGM